jgi:hypothetical protein
MKGQPSRPVLKAGRNERSFLPSDQIAVEQADHKHDRRGHRSINGQIGLRVPKRVIRAKCRPYLQRGKPIHLRERIDDSVYTIIAQFQQEYRGLVEFYQLAINRSQLRRLKWVMECSRCHAESCVKQR